MKIEYLRNSNQQFKDLKTGTVFECSDAICMKTEEIRYEPSLMIINAVTLVNGELRYFEDFDIVTVVNCKLVVE